MGNFTYKAKNRSGNVVNGVIAADHRSAVMERLLGMGLMPLEINQAANSGNKSGSGPLFKKRIKKASISIFMRQLGDLLNAGVPLVKALTTLTNQQSTPQLKEVIHQIKTSVVSGSNLADALAEHPKLFSELQINLVHSGEVSGSLESVLNQIAEFAEKEQALISRVKTALAYPVLLFLVGTGSVIFLMTFFIPRFAVIFSDMGHNLPMPTQILMGVSHFIRTFWMVFILVIAGGVYLFRKWVNKPSGRLQYDGIKLKIPIVNDLVTKIAVSRFCRTLATLLKSGIPLLTALKVVQGATGNAVIANEISEIAGSIREGQSLAEPLRMSRIFPMSVVEMISVGEEAGNLEDVLFKVSDAFDIEVDNAVQMFVSLMEPAMILFMAIIVGFIVISMLLPVFTLNSMIK